MVNIISVGKDAETKTTAHDKLTSTMTKPKRKIGTVRDLLVFPGAFFML